MERRRIPGNDGRNFNAIKPKLTKDGSILMNIRSHVKDGAVSDYVLRTRLAIRDAGFIENEELIWHKPESPPQGSVDRPRRTWENILWFSTCKDPYVNLRAAGKLSGSIGFGRTKKAEVHYKDLHHGGTKRKSGISRVTDVFVAGVGHNSKGVKHPAAFPPLLVEKLVRTFTAEGDGVLDPFAGSGTTLFVSRFLNRRPFGIEIMPQFVNLIHQRQARIDWKDIPPLYDVEHAEFVMKSAEGELFFTPADYRDVYNELEQASEKQRWKVLDF